MPGLINAQDNTLINDDMSMMQNSAFTNPFPVDTLYANFKIPDPAAEFDSMPQPQLNERVVNLSFVPKVFGGYRHLHVLPIYSERPFMLPFIGPAIELPDTLRRQEYMDTVLLNQPEFPDLMAPVTITEVEGEPQLVNIKTEPNLFSYTRPQWFQDALIARREQQDLMYSYMISHPESIEYAYWDLPLPPVLLEEDRSFLAFIRKQEVPEFDPMEAILPDLELHQIHWLHTAGAQVQFSQAFVSPNWYQGGNNYLALLFGFNWKVVLNQVYHPKLLFQSDLSYKLALSSNPSGYMHKYTISEDNFQYNLNAGLKAFKNWYYSFNLQFKTQLLNNYEEDSNVRTAAFLSPGDLNMGLGMSYNYSNKLKTLQYTLTISPISYNLKTCISNSVDHLTYSIPVDKKSKSEIGSNVELNLDWKITPNISYKTKVFLFSDYKYLLTDWQNTFNFEINKFLSTQLFVHLRYDGSIENHSKWKKFMMREILSFGLSYTFSTKP